jgi:hypothetical protein
MMYDDSYDNSKPKRNGFTRKNRDITIDNSAMIPYKIGDIVEHPNFGMGVVTAKSGSMDSLKVRVAFEGVGSKLLALKYATLRKVE